MALARCRDCGKPRNQAEAYVAIVEPLGYFLTAAVCGSPGCERPALIWLTAKEKVEFDEGQRVFGLSTQAIKVRVTTLVLG